jgi:hypothetical protein
VSCSLENKNSYSLTIGAGGETSGSPKSVSFIEDVVIEDDCCSTQCLSIDTLVQYLTQVCQAIDVARMVVLVGLWRCSRSWTGNLSPDCLAPFPRVLGPGRSGAKNRSPDNRESR